jgi:hypothetical protein
MQLYFFIDGTEFFNSSESESVKLISQEQAK